MLWGYYSVYVYDNVYYSFGCAIPQADTVIITGGYNRNTWNTVSVYTVEGWQNDLPPLNTGRWAYACTSYRSGERRVRTRTLKKGNEILPLMLIGYGFLVQAQSQI